MQEKLLYLQVKSELKAAKSGEKRQKTVSSNRFQKWLKKSKKERTWRELGENGENSGENKPPFPTCLSGTLKILLERTFTPFFCC